MTKEESTFKYLLLKGAGAVSCMTVLSYGKNDFDNIKVDEPGAAVCP